MANLKVPCPLIFILDFDPERDYAVVIRYLIDNGADVNMTVQTGLTSLHLAASYGKLEIVQLLVDNGANYNITDEHGRRPVDLARRKKKEDIVNYLGHLDKKRGHSTF